MDGHNVEQRIREAFVAPIDEPLERRHLAAIAFALAAEPETRRQSMLSTIMSSVWTKVAAVAASAVVSTGGLAAADVLPQPMQDAVATAGDAVGLNFRSSQDDTATADELTEGSDEGDESENGDESEDNGKSVSDDVHTVLEDDSLEGREKGEAVSKAASQNRQDDEHAKRPTDAGATLPEAAEQGQENRENRGRSGEFTDQRGADQNETEDETEDESEEDESEEESGS